MSDKQYMAADLRGPLNIYRSTATGIYPSGVTPAGHPGPPASQIVALLVASGVSQQFDLSQSGFFGSNQYQAKFVRMIPESCGDTWYAWGIATGMAIDKTATGGGTGVPAFLASRQTTDELPAGQFLLLQPTNAGIFRAWITNRVD